MKKLSFLLAISLCCQLSNAQGRIRGIITDVSNAPLEFANVVLLSHQDSTFIMGVISNAAGEFVLTPPVTTELYLVQATSIGYKTWCNQVQSGESLTVRMEDNLELLDEVVVKGNLPVTRLKGDALITNVEGSLLEKTGTAQNLLDYIPGVTSQRGSLQVLGRGTPVVYINNRLVRDASELEQLSADNIKSVEVITHPGARYAASVKAVIRIQTKKAVGDGFGLSNRTSAEYNKQWGYLNQFNVNYRKESLDVFGMLFYSNNFWWQNFNATQNIHLDKFWQQKLALQETSRTRNFIGNIGMNYVFNPNHSMGFRYQLNRKPGTDSRGIMSADVFRDNSFFENTQSQFFAPSQSTQHAVNLYYAGKIGEWNVDFNTDLLLANSDDNMLTREIIDPADGDPISQDVNTFNDVNNKLYASKLVFSHKLFGGSLSLGGEYSYTSRKNDYRNPEGVINNDASEINEGGSSLFVEYGKMLGKIMVQTGLRYENVSFDYFQSGVRQDEQSKNYNNLFPSLSLSSSIGKVGLQLGYTQDITRPGFRSLRSAITYNNHYLYETGNPLLRPSITHNISLVSSYRWLQLYGAYQRVEDDVIRIIEPYSDADPTIALMKLVNATSFNRAFVMFSASPVVSFWSPRFTLGAQKQWFKADSPEGYISLNQPIVSFKWQNSLELPKGFILRVNAGWYTGYDMQNYTREPEWGMDTSLYKAFLNNRLTFQLQAYDIFQTNRSKYMYYYGSLYTMSQDIEPNSRSVSLTIRYSFNQARNKYKGTGAGESQKNRL